MKDYVKPLRYHGIHGRNPHSKQEGDAEKAMVVLSETVLDIGTFSGTL